MRSNYLSEYDNKGDEKMGTKKLDILMELCWEGFASLELLDADLETLEEMEEVGLVEIDRSGPKTVICLTDLGFETLEIAQNLNNLTKLLELMQ
jgi:DNA-binding HxlR family transcriptional regulator